MVLGRVLGIIHMWFVLVIAIHLIDTWDFTVFNSELLLIMITLSVSWNSSGYKNYMLISIKNSLIAELAERSPINIQNSSNPSAKKIWMYNHTTIQPYKVLLLTCMVKCTAGTPMPWLCSVVQWSVHWAPSWMTQVLVLAGARHCALETCGGKKNASSTFRLG